jgi:carboxymethylenebutenolidase
MANVPGAVSDPSRIKGGVIALPSGGGQIAAYLATPNQPGSYPGIVVIQEAFGLVDHICDVARRFANIGYNACAPALYWRRGGPKNPDSMDDVRPVMFGLPDSEAVQDLEAAADYLRALPGATGKIGAIGFCSGGRHSLLFACSSNKVDAAIDCWGGFIHRATPDAETSAARPIPMALAAYFLASPMSPRSRNIRPSRMCASINRESQKIAVFSAAMAAS